MRKLIIICGAALIICACQNNRKEAQKKILSDTEKVQLIEELKAMKFKDQLNRSYIALKTFDQNLIDSVNALSIQDNIKFRQTFQSELTEEQMDSLWDIQNAIDLENTNRLSEIILEYGWLSAAALDSLVDPMLFLFHTPKETIEEMQALLLGEVKAKRMAPLKYATYVDNMRKKAFQKNQLYGTGDEFDPKTNTIVPPFIENIDSTNIARKAIGLPELKEGEYRN
jgi:hypothetical protein